MNELFNVEIEREAHVHAFNVMGELDQATADTLREPLASAIAGGAEAILIDLSGCGFIDSTGLSVLVEAQRELGVNGGGFTVCCPDAQVRRLLEITGLNNTIGLFETRDEAIASLTPQGQ
jgi:anti-sigma B factor antagonist